VPWPRRIPGVERTSVERWRRRAAGTAGGRGARCIKRARTRYQLQVACRDTAELDAMLRTRKRKLGAAHTETRVVLRTAVAAGGRAAGT
jgi:hypothetical protein